MKTILLTSLFISALLNLVSENMVLAEPVLCEPTPEKIDELLIPGNILLFGEIHGTNEAPKAIYDVVCKAVGKDLNVVVGFEAPTSLSEMYKEAINGGESKQKLEKLLSSWWWQHEVQDGRRSQATRNLIEKIGAFNENTSQVSAFTFDITYEQALKNMSNRESLMADAIAQNIQEEGNTVYIILAGNIHSQTSKGVPWDKDFEPMGFLVSNQVNNVHSIMFRNDPGSWWGCDNGLCGEQKIKAFKSPDGSNGLFKSKGEDNHMWNWDIGTVSASQPAKNIKAKELPDIE